MRKLLYIIVFMSIQACEKDNLHVDKIQDSNTNEDLNSGSWEQKADVGGEPRFVAVSFTIGDKAYVGTGSSIVGVLKDFWEYNPSSDVWTKKADLPAAGREGAFGFSIGSKGYLGGGHAAVGNGELVRDFWEYDPQSNCWTRKADYPGKGLWGSVAFNIADFGYVGTGNAGLFSAETPDGNPQKDFWRYDPEQNKWTRVADFGGSARAFAVGFRIGEKGYLGTGITSPINLFKQDFWEYDPTGDKWTQKADFGGGLRGWAAGFSINQKGYIGTGRTVPDDRITNDLGERKDFWEYNPANNQWIKKTDFPADNRTSATAFSINNKGYVGTGVFEFDVYRKDLWEFTPD